MSLRSWLLMLGCPAVLTIGACTTNTADDVVESEESVSVVDCSKARPYGSGTYAGGDVVTNAGKTYQCKAGAASGWCNIGGPYAPGVGWAWTFAWDEVSCTSTGTGGTGGSGASGGTGGSTTGGTGSGGTAGRGGSAGSSGSAGKGGSGGSGGSGASGGSTATGCNTPGLVWKTGRKTNYTSYPEPGSEECIKFSGCDYMGQFAACSGVKSEEWVKNHNIAAVFPMGSLRLHDLCLKSSTGKQIVVTVYDTCGDHDCDGCCTQNRGSADALIDLESYTNDRWGVQDGAIQWADLGPTKGSGCN